jgi:uncharacterized protein
MECPVCQKPLHEMTAGAIKVQACSEGCGGLWFDARELRKAELAAHAERQPLLAVSVHGTGAERPERLHCPRDPEIVMQRHFESSERRVSLDECPQCGGIWLDPGELTVILQEFQAGNIGQNEAQQALDTTISEMEAVESIRDEQALRAEVNRTVNFIRTLFRIVTC